MVIMTQTICGQYKMNMSKSYADITPTWKTYNARSVLEFLNIMLKRGCEE
jgi:hypothetical protein